MTNDPREAAYRILCRVESGAFCSHLLASRRLDALASRDRALVHELVLGVLRHRGELDYYLERLLDYRARPIQLRLRVLLRLGIYQIKFLDRVPPHAAVNETVRLAKAAVGEHSAGLINAVLRRAVREREQPAFEELSDRLEGLSVHYSHPKWLVARWIEYFGPERAEAILRADNETPVTFFFMAKEDEQAAEILRASPEFGARVDSVAPPPGCWRLSAGPGHSLRPLVERGVAYVLDRASQCVASLVEAGPGLRVLDLCAAPGGKTVILTARMRDAGILFANDLHLARMKTLVGACRVVGGGTVHPLVADAASGVPFLPNTMFDRILVDAPCSGTGTLRRNPDLRWRIQPGELEKSSRLQSRLLRAAALHVARGGRLVYSTCSMEPEENEEVVESFLSSVPDFEPMIPALPEEYLSGTYFRTDPTMGGMDGHFAAVLRRL